MKKAFTLLLVLVHLTLPIFADSEPRVGGQIEDVNAIAAVVEDRIITVEELRRELAPIARQAGSQARSEQEFVGFMDRARQEVLQGLVDRILIYKNFEAAGYKVPQFFIENAYEEHIQDEFDGDRARFLKYLEAQGKSVREFRSELKENLIVQWMRSEKRRTQSEISPDKIEQYYQEHPEQFRHEDRLLLEQIMLTADENKSLSDIRQDAKEMLKKINSGTPISTLTGASDLGWVNRSDLHPELSEAAFALKTGEHTDVITINNAVFILQAKERKAAGLRSIDEAREEIEIILANELSREVMQRWLEDLRKDAYIKYYI